MSMFTFTSTGAAAGAKSMFLALVALFGLTAFAHCNQGCLPAQSPTSLEQAYTTDIVACAATAGLPGAYDEAADLRCRADVNCRYKLGPCAGK